ncbi:hypothetical protein B9N43_03025 [Denitratisoma sp. DHT3]|uniref:TetR/AcrR family transcriptional regulator n=1 Tax=Denitratisoma sp. DHT3 TaxID=1981880 RepID=UPI001198B586|nr:TetR/AcrR family transcriptional regulator [Denitratisoma sp. DHT3]QDX80323.1 hypothetical protein B9N43_03025 [Denitratisoma sp. DHT3]
MSTSLRSPSSAGETESRLLQAARRLATDGGYEAVTIQAVADLTGVSRVTAYKYFRNKDHLLSDLVIFWSAEAIAALEREAIGATDSGDPALRVARRLCFVIGFLRRTPRLLSAVLSASAAPGGRGSEPSSMVIQRYMGIDFGGYSIEETTALTRIFGYQLQAMLLALSAERVTMAEVEHDLHYLTKKLIG